MDGIVLVAPSPIPRFAVRVGVPVEVLAARAAAGAAAPREGVEVQVAGRHVELFVSEQRRRYWSPWLSVTLEPAGDGETLVRGRFGPHPAVWTLFMSVQMFLAFSFVFAAMAAVSLALARNGSTWPYAVMGGTFVGMWVMYLGSLLGQRLGHDQMEALHRALDDLLGVDTFDAEPYATLRAKLHRNRHT